MEALMTLSARSGYKFGGMRKNKTGALFVHGIFRTGSRGNIKKLFKWHPIMP